jgi:hypothetical protein
VPISAADAAMQGPVIAEAFKRSYLRRLEGRLKRGELTWIGQSAPMAKSKVLTPKARSLVDTIRAKRWVVDVQQTPSHYRGAVGVVNYLSAYVSGTAIGNGRIVGDDGQRVEIRIKDYAAGKGQRSTMKLTGDEFVRRFTDHILPRHFQRVRYAGLFTAARRHERLAVCREKLADYYRSRDIRMPRGLAGGVTETVQLESNRPVKPILALVVPCGCFFP